MKAKMDKLAVRVTKADIQYEYARHPEYRVGGNCPVARAMNRALGVNDGYATGDRYCSEAMLYVYFELPLRAQIWIKAYDNSSVSGGRLKAQPFSFSLLSKDVRGRV